MRTRLSLSVGDGTSKNTFYLSLSTHDKRKREKYSRAGVTSRASWKCFLLEKYRNTKRKDGSREGEAVTGVRMNLMIHATSTATTQAASFFLFYLYQQYTYKPTLTNTHTPAAGWGRNTKQFFTRWSHWAILSPVALHISGAPSFIALSSAAVHYIAQSGREILWGADLAKSILSSVNGITLLT